MYVNKDGHCISNDGDMCIGCIHDGYNECLFHKAISNYVGNSSNYVNIRIDECGDFESNEDNDGPDLDWWAYLYD